MAMEVVEVVQMGVKTVEARMAETGKWQAWRVGAEDQTAMAVRAKVKGVLGALARAAVVCWVPVSKAAAWTADATADAAAGARAMVVMPEATRATAEVVPKAVAATVVAR